MKNRFKKITKRAALMLLLAFTLSLPLGALGQGLLGGDFDRGDNQGVFGRGKHGATEGNFTHQTFGNDYDGTFTHQTFGNDQDGNFTHQTFGNDAPVSSGLLILLSAGLGYAATKRKTRKTK